MLTWNSEYIREPVQCGSRFHGVFAPDSFRSSREEKNNFLLVSDSEENSGGLCVAEVLLLFGTGVR